MRTKGKVAKKFNFATGLRPLFKNEDLTNLLYSVVYWRAFAR
jgi:hypothetical protein